MTGEPWIEWAGGRCPVSRDTLVEIRLLHRDGSTWDRRGSEEAGHFDDMRWWDGTAMFNRIIAYRVVPASPVQHSAEAGR